MQTFSIASPPPSPGIYMLVNSATKQVYIGKSVNLRRRHQEWRGVLVQGLGARSYLMGTATAGSNPNDWTFNVVLNLPGATDGELTVYEERAINHLQKTRPKSLLNTVVQNLPRMPNKEDGPATITVVVDDDGVIVPRSKAAEILGNTRKVLQKKLASRRARGIDTVRLSDLVADKEKHYHPQTKVA